MDNIVRLKPDFFGVELIGLYCWHCWIWAITVYLTGCGLYPGDWLGHYSRFILVARML